MSKIILKQPEVTLPLLVKLAAACIVVWAFVEARSFLLPVVVATMLALMLMPLVRFLRRHRVPEWVAITAAALVFLLPFAGLASILTNEAQGLIHEWPHIKTSAGTYLQSLVTSSWLKSFNLQQYLSIDELADRLGDKASEGIGFALAGLSLVFTAGSQIVLVVFFAMMMIQSRNHLRTAFEHILLTQSSFKSPKILDDLTTVIEQFLLARLIIIVAVALADFGLFEIFGMPYAVSLAVLQGLMTLIPVVGFIIGLIPVAMIGIAQGNSTLWTVGIMLLVWGVASLQDHVLTPKLIGQRLNLNFFITYLALFAGERLWGIWGMFLAIPALGVVRILIMASEDLKPWGELIQDRSEDEPKVPVVTPVST